jgi:integration host factor subunit beta
MGQSKRRMSARTIHLMELPAGFPRSPNPPKSFNRSELIRSIYERFQRNNGEDEGPRLKRRAQAESLVIAVLDEIAGALERGKRVELRGVGVLTVKEKRERQGRNPRTGEALIIDPHRVVRFRVSELLLARLNQPSRRPERPKSDPRQLAFRIDGDQEKPGNIHTGPTLPRLTRGRTRRTEGAIYEKDE